MPNNSVIEEPRQVTEEIKLIKRELYWMLGFELVALIAISLGLGMFISIFIESNTKLWIKILAAAVLLIVGVITIVIVFLKTTRYGKDFKQKVEILLPLFFSRDDMMVKTIHGYRLSLAAKNDLIKYFKDNPQIKKDIISQYWRYIDSKPRKHPFQGEVFVFMAAFTQFLLVHHILSIFRSYFTTEALFKKRGDYFLLVGDIGTISVDELEAKAPNNGFFKSRPMGVKKQYPLPKMLNLILPDVSNAKTSMGKDYDYFPLLEIKTSNGNIVFSMLPEISQHAVHDNPVGHLPTSQVIIDALKEEEDYNKDEEQPRLCRVFVKAQADFKISLKTNDRESAVHGWAKELFNDLVDIDITSFLSRRKEDGHTVPKRNF